MPEPRPVEPPPSPWAFPEVRADHDDDLVAVGADLEPGTLLEAYRHGYFPMPLDKGRAMGWWSPDPRGVLEIDRLRVSRSLRRSLRRFEIRVDTAFEEVLTRCADPLRPHGWIDRQIIAAYTDLHRLGWAHSVEAWLDGRLVGGLYGVSIGGLFAGESMFATVTDSSKVCLVALVDIIGTTAPALIDVQWTTPHLTSLGATEMSRTAYRDRLSALCAAPTPTWATDGGGEPG